MTNEMLPLKIIRLVQNWTLEDMAECFSVTKSFMSAIECGKSNMSFETLKSGLDIIGISIESYNTLVGYANYLDSKQVSNTDKYRILAGETYKALYQASEEFTGDLKANDHGM